MQQMGGRVIDADGRAPIVVDDQFHRLTNAQFTFADAHMVREDAVVLMGVGDGGDDALALELTAVPDLTAAFAIERRLVEHGDTGFTGSKDRNLDPIAQQGLDLPFGHFRFIPEELAGADLVGEAKPNRVGCGFA